MKPWLCNVGNVESTQSYTQTSLKCLPHSFYVILRGSVSLLVDPNFQKALLQGTIAASTLNAIANREGRRPSKPSKREAASRHIYGREINKLFMGDHFGEEALLQKEERAPHTARTNEKVELICVHVSVFNQFLHTHFQEIMMKRAEFLANLECLRQWTPQLLRQLAFMLQERRYRFGECLYRQEMHVPGMWFIQSGAVRISTHSNRQAPEELVSKIEPPKDYLPEILAEDQQNSGGSKVSVFSNASKRTMDSQPLITPGSSRYTSANSLVRIQSNPRLQTNPPPLKKQRSVVSAQKTKLHHKEHKGKQPMGFIIHHPKPSITTNICILGPGDTLGDMEAICKLKKHLFHAVCESDVVVYELNRFYFELMFERKVPRVLYQMSCRAKQRVESWGAQHPGILMLKPLGVVLEQIEHRLVEEGAHKQGRKKKTQYTPEILAYTAIKGLGKNPYLSRSNTSLFKRESSLHFPVIQIEPPESSLTSPALAQTSPMAVSPFEPQVPDFERMASMMLYSHPRFKGQQNGKNIFDSPVPTKRSTNSIVLPNAGPKNAIPIPVPYPTQKPGDIPSQPSALTPSNQNFVETNSGKNHKPLSQKRDPVISMGEIFSRTNEPHCLSMIRLGIMCSKDLAPKAPTRNWTSSSLSSSNISLALDRNEARQRSWRSKSACTRDVTPIPFISARRSISYDGYSLLKEEGGGMQFESTPPVSGSKMRQKRLKISFSVDNELTDIPKEYSSLFKVEEVSGQPGAGEECLGCGQGSSRSHCKSCPPFVKTMEQVIEDRTSYMLTK